MENQAKKLIVVDLTRALAGPYCTMMLGDIGAEIIKVERPGAGDDARSWGAEFTEGFNSYFVSINRNKKSITVDMKTEKGLAIVQELVKKADVVVENFRPGVTQKLKLDYPTLKALNPGLIYCSITGFGSTGPDAARPAFDLIAQGMGGIMGFTGEKGRMPVKVGTPIGDIIAGIFGAFGIMRALWHRECTGKGQLVETSLLGGQIALHSFQAGRYFTTGISPEPEGNIHPLITPYESFPTSDGYINIAAGNDTLWRRFCEILDLHDLIEDPRFITNPKRVENREALTPILQEKTRQYTKAELLDLMAQAKVPNGPISTLEEVFSSPQVHALKMLQEVEHPVAGNLKVTGIPVNYSETPGEIKYPPPLLGEQTEEILTHYLGYSTQEIEKLREQGVV